MQADRALTQDEHCQILEILRLWDDAGTTAMINFLHHSLARVDDIAHVKKKTLKVGSNSI